MSSNIDSVAVFQKRVESLELEELWPKFKALGWTTKAKFAFASPVAPDTRKAMVSFGNFKAAPHKGRPSQVSCRWT